VGCRTVSIFPAARRTAAHYSGRSIVLLSLDVLFGLGVIAGDRKRSADDYTPPSLTATSSRNVRPGCLRPQISWVRIRVWAIDLYSARVRRVVLYAYEGELVNIPEGEVAFLSLGTTTSLLCGIYRNACAVSIPTIIR